MATAIKIYSTDSNENSITKTVSNANPDASDYVLKNFGMQLMTLSNNAFRRAERIDTKDITSASTDTGAANITINSTTDYFSTDNATYKAAVNALTNSSLTIELTASNNITYKAFIDLGRAKVYSNWSEFAKYISSMLIGAVDEKFTQLAELEGKNNQMIFCNFGTKIIQTKLVQPTDNPAFVTAIWTNITQPSASDPYTITFSTEGSTTVINILPKE